MIVGARYRFSLRLNYPKNPCLLAREVTDRFGVGLCPQLSRTKKPGSRPGFLNILYSQRYQNSKVTPPSRPRSPS